ncbi:putative holin-like toxin [Paenibacillus elgii]|nr:putative holin-like toxin [Paenibacillus elgii]
MPVEVKDTLTLMIGFGMLVIALLTLIVNIILALIQNKKK